MPHSDSDDFESADEGQTTSVRKERKKRNSSSNYSDNLDLDVNTEKSQPQQLSTTNASQNPNTDGWDDFEIDENESIVANDGNADDLQITTEPRKPNDETKDTGWDDFDDWGQNENANMQNQTQINKPNIPDPQIQEVTDKLAAASTKSNGWGWGWGMDTILSTATAGITTITSQVSQGISTVLETGIGAPDPEELARKTVKESSQPKDKEEMEKVVPESVTEATSSDAAFPFGNLLSGVTKFVETTGTKVITGGLDTLETIGKKTMEVLQDGDPGLAKKRALLGLDSGDKPVLSQILREAKEKAEEEDRIKEAKREAKEVHYESLFDDFEGLVHLEALEMLSRQVNMRIEECLRNAAPEKKQDIKETLQQIAELCEMPDDDDEEVDEEQPSEDMSKVDVFHEKLQRATRDIGLKMQFQPLIKQYESVIEESIASSGGESKLEANIGANSKPGASSGAEAKLGANGAKAHYKRAVGALARGTALSVQLMQRTAQGLLIKQRRSTADEADALAQLTLVLKKHISELATLFSEEMSKLPDEDKDSINNYITNIFLEAENSSKYIENAFQLTLPIIQIGAI